jgi:hypothetical protein
VYAWGKLAYSLGFPDYEALAQQQEEEYRLYGLEKKRQYDIQEQLDGYEEQQKQLGVEFSDTEKQLIHTYFDQHFIKDKNSPSGQAVMQRYETLKTQLKEQSPTKRVRMFELLQQFSLQLAQPHINQLPEKLRPYYIYALRAHFNAYYLKAENEYLIDYRKISRESVE